MEFSSNNSYYNQDLYAGLDTDSGFWHQPYNLESQDFFDPSLQAAYSYVVTKFEPTPQPLMPSFPEHPAMESSRTVELPCSSEIRNDGDGCTFEELIQLLNEETTGNPNPWNEVAQSISSSSRESKQLKKERRRRRPSVRFVDLMNKNKLSVGDRVYYRRKINRDVAVGMVRRLGIECCCCGEVYSMSKFEEHVGKASHRAPRHIYVENGKSLEMLQLEILEEQTN